ncbi:MAG: response regulator [Syntrophobacteraceae bacterium]
MEKIKVLLVDDEEEFVKALAERLEIRGLDVKVALNGEKGLFLVKEWEPDVMVLDLKMPGIDGLEVLRRTKMEHEAIQVIILTGHGSERDYEMARRLGAYDQLQKPADIGTLFRCINSAHQTRFGGARG